MITIRRIHTGEGALFRDLRLAALKSDPHAFGSTYESALERSVESWSQQADSTAEGSSRSTFIAFRNGEPVGISAIYGREEKKNEAEVFQVWIAPDLRGSGLAKKMMDTVFDWAESNDYTKIIGEVTQNNGRALSFYRNYGFEVVSETVSEIKIQKSIRSNKS
ncbi:GNAT family N-acetyltransferase [Puniceicoccaceae bacterium K14]|nr:GNAT family N-acetyltransferase [Puniceicoccaceae bacterium K14]